MKKCCSWLPEATAIAGVAIGVGVAFSGWPAWPEAEGQTWAAWVQAVGSVGAILVAVWVVYKQHKEADKRQERTQREVVRNFLLGVREELAITWRVYMAQVGTELAKTEDGEIVRLYWPAPESPFKVYGATVGQIGCVPDDELRALIIQTYVIAGGLLYTWETHNRQLKDFDYLDRTPRSRSAIQAQVDYRADLAALIEYGEKLRNHQNSASEAIDETIEAIDQFLCRPGSLDC